MKLHRRREFHISLVLDKHLPKLADIHSRSFSHGWSEDSLSSTLRSNGVSCLVASLIGKESAGPKGFLILRTMAPQSEILTIAIDPKFRNRGIAKALLEHAIRQLQKDRIDQLILEVSEKNKAALGLYNSLNFKPIHVREGYYTNPIAGADRSKSPKANALVMQLELR